MSSKVFDKLSGEKIQQLLAAVGSQPTNQAEQVQATVYDWHQPHYFNSEQLKKLDNFTRKLAATMAASLNSRFKIGDSKFEIHASGTTQHWASEFMDSPSDRDKNNYYLLFGTEQTNSCGLISIPVQTAAIWTTQLLGDSGAEKGTDRDLSPLEESLLLDFAHLFFGAFSGSDETGDFHPAQGITKRQWPLNLPGTEELCKITFSLTNAEPENTQKIGDVHLIISSSKLAPIVGKTEQDIHRFSVEDISQAILEHIQQIPVSITAQLACTMLTFNELMALQVDDIVLLDKHVDEPIELLVDGQAVFYGWPAKSAGQYAVVIETAQKHRATL